MADRADDAARQRAAVAADDHRPQPRRRDLDARVGSRARSERVVVLRRQLGHPVLRDDRFDGYAEPRRRLRVHRGAIDDARAAFEAARFHDPRAGGQRERGAAFRERVKQRDERERGRRDAHRDAGAGRARGVAHERIGVERVAAQIPAALAVTALARDDVHHVAQRAVRPLARLGHEVHVAQPGAVGEQHAVERREQRCVVQPRRRQLVPPAAAARRPAGLEPRRGLVRRKRREPRLFERGGRHGGDVLDPRRRMRCIEAGRARERAVRRVAFGLVREQIAREREERVVVQRVRADRGQHARVERRCAHVTR